MSYKTDPRPLDQADDAAGFTCPEGCKAEVAGVARPQPLRVIDTVRSAAGLVTRYRRCPCCKFTMTTWEQARPKLKALPPQL